MSSHQLVCMLHINNNEFLHKHYLVKSRTKFLCMTRFDILSIVSNSKSIMTSTLKAAQSRYKILRYILALYFHKGNDPDQLLIVSLSPGQTLSKQDTWIGQKNIWSTNTRSEYLVHVTWTFVKTHRNIRIKNVSRELAFLKTNKYLL